MLNSQNLINKICACISGGGLTALQTCQLNGALNALCAPVCSVAAFSNLPTATDNVGRMIYVHAENRYYHAFNGLWLSDFQSTIYNYENSAWSWGCNGSGILGDNTTTSRSSPVSVMGGFLDWCQVSAGRSLTAAVRSSGSIRSWGSNTTGQLGDNTTTSRSSPVSVVGDISDWCQVSAGACHTVALRASGSAWAWGSNQFGQLGNGTTTNRSSPVSVVGGFSDWCQASAGFYHNVALRTSGSAWTWGCNSFGKLGDCTLTDRSSPVSVVGGFTDWCKASAGNNHTVAVRTSGSAWAWGEAGNGLLGDNTIVNKSSPVSVVGGFSDWRQAGAGPIHTVAVRSSGSAWAWGYNSLYGRLGDGTVATRSSPVSVLGGFTDWCQASAGGSHSVAARTSGSAWAWGRNNYGQLGDGTQGTRLSPVAVVGGFTDWCQVSAGYRNSVAVRQEVKGF